MYGERSDGVSSGGNGDEKVVDQFRSSASALTKELSC